MFGLLFPFQQRELGSVYRKELALISGIDAFIVSRPEYFADRALRSTRLTEEVKTSTAAFLANCLAVANLIGVEFDGTVKQE
jgi:hypothetical protein